MTFVIDARDIELELDGDPEGLIEEREATLKRGA